MALYHFSVKQVSRGKGQTVVNSAAYISGQKLYNDYYGQVHDYTRKSGVMFTEILKPDYVPERLSDRETLWNEVERAEKGKRAQLAYSFDIALQNELTLEENIQLISLDILKNIILIRLSLLKKIKRFLKKEL